jgi:hypothetical protein
VPKKLIWDVCKSAADFQSAEEGVAFPLVSADKMSAARCFAEILIYENRRHHRSFNGSQQVW